MLSDWIDGVQLPNIVIVAGAVALVLGILLIRIVRRLVVRLLLIVVIAASAAALLWQGSNLWDAF